MVSHAKRHSPLWSLPIILTRYKVRVKLSALESSEFSISFDLCRRQSFIASVHQTALASDQIPRETLRPEAFRCRNSRIGVSRNLRCRGKAALNPRAETNLCPIRS